LIGLNPAQELPAEILIKFNFPKIVESRAESGSSDGGIYFDFEELSEEEIEDADPPITGGAVRVEIHIKPRIVPGFHSNDYIIVRHNGSAGPASQSSSNTGVTFPFMEGCGGTNFQEGVDYYLRVSIYPDRASAKIWLASEEEPASPQRTVAGATSIGDDFRLGFSASLAGKFASCGPSLGTPCLDFSDQSEEVLFSFVSVNPAAIIGTDCDEVVDTSLGMYLDVLLKRTAFWVPSSTENFSRYQQVYFDGIPVTEGEDYWLDGVKLYPQDPSIFADTRATALVVLE
jgi:hypothetical protein